jgi:tetratricopeptide (TPR) repeat protein
MLLGRIEMSKNVDDQTKFNAANQVKTQLQSTAVNLLVILVILSVITIILYFIETKLLGKADVHPGKYLLILAMAGFFPITAAAYQLFQREKELSELQTDFELLGIVESNSSARKSIEDVVQRYNLSHDTWNYVLQFSLPFLLTIVGLSLFFWPPSTTDLLDEETLLAVRFGFLGAYTFSMQLVYRRYTTLDLQPTVFMSCGLTLIAGIAFNYVAFSMLSSLFGSTPSTNTEPLSGIEAGALAIIAFSLGYFPNLAIRWFNQIASNALGVRQRRMDLLSLNMIEGISQFHEIRLREEGIDNIENLASLKIDELLLNTRFNAQQVIEWVDQAILFLYLRPGDVDSFRRGGIRRISDFLEFWKPPYFVELISADGTGDTGKIQPISKELREARRSRAQQVQSTPEYLDILYTTASEGPNMAYIETYWKNTKVVAQERIRKFVAEDRAKGAITESRSYIFEAISKLDPRDETLTNYGKLADILAQDFDEDSLNDEDTKPDILIGLARWLFFKTEPDYSKAKQLLDKALNQSPEPDKARVWNELAWLYLVSDKSESERERARSYAQKAVDFSESTGDFPEPYYLDTLAQVYIKLDEPDKSVERINQALEVIKEHNMEPNPIFYDAMITAAEKFIEQEDYSRAQDIIKQVRKEKHIRQATDEKAGRLLTKIPS